MIFSFEKSCATKVATAFLRKQCESAETPALPRGVTAVDVPRLLSRRKGSLPGFHAAKSRRLPKIFQRGAHCADKPSSGNRFMKIAYINTDQDAPVFGRGGCSVHIQE